MLIRQTGLRVKWELWDVVDYQDKRFVNNFKNPEVNFPGCSAISAIVTANLPPTCTRMVLLSLASFQCGVGNLGRA